MTPIPVPTAAQVTRPWGHLLNFGPPEGHATTPGLEDCGSLPVLLEVVPDSALAKCRSYWQPSPEDLVKLNAGEPVQLIVWGRQVPVDLQVGP